MPFINSLAALLVKAQTQDLQDLRKQQKDRRAFFRHAILYYTILYCTILYYTILYYTMLYYTIRAVALV